MANGSAWSLLFALGDLPVKLVFSDIVVTCKPGIPSLLLYTRQTQKPSETPRQAD